VVNEKDLDMVIGNRHGGEHAARDAAAGPAQTVCTGETLAIVRVQRNGDVQPADQVPVHTVRAGGQHHALVMRNNNSRGNSGAMLTPDHEPVRAVTTAGHQSVVMPYYGKSAGGAQGSTDPVPTVPANDRFALVVPAGGCRADATQAADREPVATLTANESRAVVWTDDDIDECRFRMFELHEIAGAMVMHRHTDGSLYEVLGNRRERMAQYGNSVTPPAMAWLIGRLLEVIEAEVFVDLFCGAGGSSLGAELAGAKLALGLNHWQRAVETHATNFQHADHDCEDISSLTTNQIRRYLHHANADMLIAGPECTNHSIAKGARRRKPQAASLWEDGPGNDDEQDKSRATMWDVVRFAEQAILAGQPFKAIVVENVVDAFRWGADDNGALFNAWLMAMDGLGYEHEIVWLNSMFAPPAPNPAPQSRDRMYPVFWRKGIPKPNLLVEPPAWCPHCEKVVHGRQTWKRPDRRPWGRYGAQYLYSCPDCWKPALPGAFPANLIIDRALPAQKIGERKKPLAKNTRERIRRGLERLAREPFAIRLMHGGAPKPLTLPLVTLTARHDLAMVEPAAVVHPRGDDGGQLRRGDVRPSHDPVHTVAARGQHHAVVFPVAGNTFERTSGNRAQDADRQPLATVHGTLDRAIVVPPMGQVEPRAAATAPAPTQTTTTRPAVVLPNEDAA
jgi:DNA (cytosine-5)-methyltransferase 1